MRLSRPLTTLAIVLLPSTLHAHIHLVRSTPAADSLATGPVREIRLAFSEHPELAFTRVRLFAADSAEIPLGALRAVDSLGVAIPLSARLAAGTYTVRWQTAGTDGHVIRGEFAFTAPEDRQPDSVAVSEPAPLDAPETEGGFPIAIVAIAGAAALTAFFLLRGRR